MIIMISLVTLIATIAALYGYNTIREQAQLVSGSSLKTKRSSIQRKRNEVDDVASAYLNSLAR